MARAPAGVRDSTSLVTDSMDGMLGGERALLLSSGEWIYNGADKACVLQVGFGSGFKCNSAVWKAVRNIHDTEHNEWAHMEGSNLDRCWKYVQVCNRALRQLLLDNICLKVRNHDPVCAVYRAGPCRCHCTSEVLPEGEPYEGHPSGMLVCRKVTAPLLHQLQITLSGISGM